MTIAHYGLFGKPVALSPSPQIHQYFANSLGEQIQYSKYEITENDFNHAVKNFFEKGGQGLNITIPHKQSAFKLAEVLSVAAQQANAVNTLWMEAGKLYGDNTDGIGFIKDLEQKQIQLKNKKIMILGAGGAVRGILGPLLDQKPQQLFIANRTQQKVTQLVSIFENDFHLQTCSLDELPEMKFDVVINGLSLHKFPLQINPGLNHNAAYYDLKYGEAAESGINWATQKSFITICDGWGMLVRQAAESYSIWHGKKPDVKELIIDSQLIAIDRIR